MAPTSTSRLPRWAVAATVGVALLLVAILVAISAAGGPDPTNRGEIAGTSEVLAMLDGIPQKGPTLGDPAAPVEIVEFADMQCSFCAEAAAQTLPNLIESYVRSGRAKLTMRPMAFIGPDSRRGAMALAAAAAHDKMWHWTELAYRNQGRENGGWLSDDLVREIAEAVGLELSGFEAARRGDDAKRFVDDAARTARATGVQSTPTFVVIGRSGSIVVDDYRNRAAFDAAIESVR